MFRESRQGRDMQICDDEHMNTKTLCFVNKYMGLIFTGIICPIRII